MSAARNLKGLGRAALEAMRQGGEAMAAAERALAAEGATVVTAALGAAGACVPWQHYPAGDVYDRRSHAQFFYHAHPEGERTPNEHGHFHLFLRAGGMAPGTRPLVLPELVIAGAAPVGTAPSAPEPHAGEDGEWCHIVAIAMNSTGEPIRLFTTNRWVTGETWYRAVDVIEMLDRFSVSETGPLGLLNRWIGGAARFFRPQIAHLIAERDEAVMGWRRRRRGKAHVFEDRRLEVTSALDISVAAQFAAIDAALGAAA
ncbi:MAG TPA: hypothetical protein VLV50_13340 [Stellaceae bacterium]|nr:hypothetical protein [Stellaceae bacterium]